MNTIINDEIYKLLSKFGDKYIIDSKINKSKVLMDLENYDSNFLEVLLSSQIINNNFSLTIAGNKIIQINKLKDIFEMDDYWQDSFTKYSKRIGLTANGKFLDEGTDVVLDFPYKDTVLKASMSREDKDKDGLKSDEPFLNEIIAKDEIDVLLDKKILVNAKKYDLNGYHDVNVFEENDNLIIKGNNLLALHTIKEKYAGKIKLIYIDPPFNTNNDSFDYNDKFSRSAWLTFMKNRIEIAKELLSNEGSIVVHIDWHQSHYLKILLDNIFGEENFINEIIWKYSSGGSYKNSFAKKHDSLFWYSKTGNYQFSPNNILVGEKRGPQKRNNMKRNIDEDGRVYYSIKSSGKEYRYYEDDLVVPSDVWDLSILQQQDPERTGFNSQKPERLLARIISAMTTENDIVLDFFMGSATTQAVALKLNRRFIGIEQMEYINTISIPRLQKVIDGEKVGISKDLNWQGGGSYVYVELMEKNRGFLKSIESAETQAELNKVFQFMINGADIDFKVDLEKVKDTLHELTFLEQKRLLVKIIDKNQLYYNYSEINDKNVRDLISENDYEFNMNFYKKTE